MAAMTAARKTTQAETNYITQEHRLWAFHRNAFQALLEILPKGGNIQAGAGYEIETPRVPT